MIRSNRSNAPRTVYARNESRELAAFPTARRSPELSRRCRPRWRSPGYGRPSPTHPWRHLLSSNNNPEPTPISNTVFPLTKGVSRISHS